MKRIITSCLIVIFLFLMPTAVHAQSTLPEPIPPSADAGAGVQTFRQRCSNCHGALGLGDGELAAQLPNPPTAIGSPEYLATADPAVIFETIQQGNVLAGMPAFGVGGNSNPLSDEEIWDIVAGLYSLEQFSQPIETAQINGRVVNGTTGEVMANNTAILQAFTADFTEALQLETTTDEDGRYSFDLTNIPPDWFYRTVSNYEGLDFTSDFVPLTPFVTEATLPVTVYESTTSDTAVSVGQLEVIFTFGDGLVQVAEFYTFNHNDPAVYVGETGNYTGGTLSLAIPEGAENVSVLRNVGGVTDFVPMDEQMIVVSPTERRVAWPLSPGRAGLRLLLRYTFPYERALDISHPFFYPVENGEAILPTNGVALANEGWEQQEITYSETNDPALNRVRYQIQGDSADFVAELRGFPNLVLSEDGTIVPVRDEQQELWTGGIGFVLVLAIVAGLAWSWRTAVAETNDQDQLLQELAALDAAFQENKIRRTAYRRRREQLKTELRDIWQE